MDAWLCVMGAMLVLSLWLFAFRSRRLRWLYLTVPGMLLAWSGYRQAAATSVTIFDPFESILPVLALVPVFAVGFHHWRSRGADGCREGG